MKKTILFALLSSSVFSIQAMAQEADRIVDSMNQNGHANAQVVIQNKTILEQAKEGIMAKNNDTQDSAHLFNAEMLNAQPLAIDVKWVKHQKPSFLGFLKSHTNEKIEEQSILTRDGFPISGAQTMDVSYLSSIDVPKDETLPPKFETEAVRTGFKYAFTPQMNSEEKNVALQYQLDWVNLNSIHNINVGDGFTVQNPDVDTAHIMGQTKVKLNVPTVLMNHNDYDVVVTVHQLGQ